MCNDLFCDYVAVDESVGNNLLSAIDKIASAPNDFKHYLWLLQSSGYGKTKRCIELMKTYKACYILCESIEGGFKENAIVELLKANINSEYVGNIIQQIYQLMQKRDAADLFQCQFLNNYYENEFLKTAIDNLTMVSEADVDNHPVSDQFFLLIFDEAHNLGPDLMKTIKLQLDCFNIIGIFLSTNGHLGAMIPTTQSIRTIPRKYVQPVTLLCTFDLHDDKCNKFFLGRPLWYQMFLKFRNNMHSELDNLTTLIIFAAGKLSGGASIQDESTALSAFMCRFGGLTPVNEDAASKFVTNHMATYCDIELNYAGGEKRNVKCEISYPSEPILVEASAYLTSRFKSKDAREENLGIVKKSIFSQSYVTELKGDVGELMASVLLCYTLDVIREDKIEGPKYEAGVMSASVDIIKFLKSLYPDILLQEDIKNVLDSIKEYVTDVTHFVRLPYVSNLSTCTINLIRGVAIITPKYHPSVDFYMSFSLPSSSRCPIHCRVQVKNKSNNINRAMAQDLLNLMTNRCIPTADQVEDINEISISILINVGSGILEPFAFIHEPNQTRNSTCQSKYICIALNIRVGDEKRCFEDLSDSILQLVRDIAACDNNHKTEQMMKMSLGKTYYNDLKACI